MTKSLFIYLLITSFLSSCATMSVKVSVIDQKALRKMPGVLESQTNSTERIIDGNIKNAVYDKQRAVIKSSLDTIVSQQLKLGVSDTLTLNTMKDAVSKEIDNAFYNAKEAYNQGLLSAENARGQIDNSTQHSKLLREAQTNFARGNAYLEALAIKLDEDFNINGWDTKALEKENKNIKEVIYTLTQGAELLNDPLVSFVVKTKHKRKYWKGVYNKTVTRNAFGNSDVAIAMESLGNFTIKGVRLDAANMVAASFKTLSQGIQLLSTIYGVPVGTKEDAESTTTPSGGTNLEVMEKEKELEINKRLSKLSTVAIMDAILSKRSDLQNSATLPAAVSSIKTTFDIYKPQLTH